MDTTDATVKPRTRLGRRGALGLAAATLVVAAGGAAVVNAASASDQRPTMPTDPQVETRAGIRLTRVSLAADGGLIDVRYIVLNPTLATQWTGDTDKPPVIANERNGDKLDRVAAMREGHDLRAGQTYYLIYLNKGGTLHRGDKIDLEIAGTTLRGVPVE
jgi:hypothetical protein